MKKLQDVSQTLLFSLEVTPVSRAQLVENGSVKQTHGFSGRRCYEWLKSLDSTGLLTKMLPEVFLTGYWIKRSASWKMLATPAGRPLLSLQVRSEQGMNGRESGLLPTPLADDWKGGTNAPRKDNGKLRDDQFRHWWKIVTGRSTPDPTFLEEFMGFPIGHTENNGPTPLETQ